MSLHRQLLARAEAGRPIRVGMIGAGKFGSMYLAQARRTAGVHIVGLADLSAARAADTLRLAGWPEERFEAADLATAMATGKTCLTEDSAGLIAFDGLDVLIEATGDPAVGIRHALAAFEHGLHVVMVNVEADALAGPLLARKAAAAGVIYSLAWGDQPALICEHVDWARTCGFEVVTAGKGTRYHPSYHQLTPQTVWEELEKYLVIADRKMINPKMFNSFLDGTKSGIEMTAVCNATGLTPQAGGLRFPPASRFELAEVLKPAAAGGGVAHAGTTEVTSSLTRDGGPVDHHLAMGTFVVIHGDSDYVRQCFAEYHMLADNSGAYAALYRPTHMIGLELGQSVASVALRGEPTGAPSGFHSDVVATAKRNLAKGEVLDGEGGYCVWGKQAPAAASLAGRFLPIGLAQNVTLVRDVAVGQVLTRDDVALDDGALEVRFRGEMEAAFGG